MMMIFRSKDTGRGHLLPYHNGHVGYQSISPTPGRHVHFDPEVLIQDKEQFRLRTPMWDTTAIKFGARISFLLFISSLFVVIKVDGNSWPQGGWIVITTLMVSWFPSMDAASVIEKSIQRCMGTLMGGFFGLFLGSLCYQIPHPIMRAMALETCFVLGAFSVCFWSVQLHYSRTMRVINRFSYATSLCILTYTIAIFPFLESSEGWKKAAFRLLNVAIGSFIGTAGSIVVLPKRTTALLVQKIHKQVELAGEASEAIMHSASDAFSGKNKPQNFSSSLLEAGTVRKRRKMRNSLLRKSFARINKAIIDEGNDIPLEKYEEAIKEWRVTKGLFSLLAYDPFNSASPSREYFVQSCAAVLGRALRVQTTVILMDGIVRNDPSHCFDQDSCSMFMEVGTLTRKMLSSSSDEETKESARLLLLERLALIRNTTAKLAQQVVSDFEEAVFCRNSFAKSKQRQSIICDDGSNRHIILFLQLAEHLVVRCLALFDSSTEIDGIATDLN